MKRIHFINRGQRLSPSARKIIKLRQRAFQSGGASLELQIPTNYIRDISRDLNEDITKESPRRNIANYSNDFTNAVWAKTNMNFTVSAIANPINGAVTATKFLPTTTGGVPLVEQTITGAIGDIVTVSAYVKGAEWNTISLKLVDGALTSLVFNTDTQAVTGNASSVVVETLANGWFRLSFTRTVTTATYNFDIALGTTGGLADGIKGFYVYGSQVEKNASATAYQETTQTNTDNGASLIMTPNTIGEGRLFNCKPELRNLHKYSEDQSNAAWIKQQSTVTPNATTNPIDGANNAFKLIPNNGQTGTYLNQAFAYTVGSNYTLSIYAKAAEYAGITIQIGTTNRRFDLVNGVIFGTTSSATITSAGGGWYRCSFTLTATSNQNALFQPLDSSGNQVTGNGTNGVIVWGSQLELSSVLTAYQRTTDGIIDFQATRATTATVIQKDGSIGEACYNLLQRSEEYDNATWSKPNCTVSVNATTSPNGTLTADKLIENATASNKEIFQGVNFSAGITYNFSVYVKAAERNFFRLQPSIANFPNTSVIFDVNNNSYNIVNGTPINPIITDVGNGWKRCSYSLTCTTSGTSVNVFHTLAISSTSITYTGDGTSGMFFWGSQISIGSQPKDYLKTTNRLAVPSISYMLGSDKPALLVEPARTNLRTFSEDLSSAVYAYTNASAVLVSTASPSGSTSVYRLTEDSSNNTHYVRSTVTLVAGTASFSCFIKSSGRDYVVFFVDFPATNNTLSVHLPTKTVFSQNAVSNIQIKDAANGFVRISFDLTTSASPYGIRIFTSNDGTMNPYLGNGTSGLLVWGLQYEQGSGVTSYIPTTTTTTVTRNSYTSFVDLQNNSALNQNNFTLFVEGYLRFGDTTNISFGLSDTVATGARANDIGFFDGIKATYAVGSTLTSDTTNLSNENYYKFAIQRDGTSVKFFRNGAQIWTTQTIAVFDYRYLVLNTGGSTFMVQKIALWKSTKTDAECITLTT